MKLYQVRKGQFVYYNNDLHKVYSVKAMFKKSIHMYRLKDMNQVLTRAEDIELYKPQPMDSFVFYGKRYTLRNDRDPQKGDYILITRPAPEFLDHYSLNEIEKVARVEEDNVITTHDNAVRREEFLIMDKGEDPDSKDIAYKDRSLITEDRMEADNRLSEEIETELTVIPAVGDIYFHSEEQIRTMITAIKGETVYFGHGEQISMRELDNDENWTMVYNTKDGSF